MNRWTLGRWALEASRQPQQPVGRLDSPSSSSIATSNALSSPAMAASASRGTRSSAKKTKSHRKKKKKRRLSDDQNDLMFGLPVPASGPDAFPNLSDRDIYQQIWHNKTKEGSGRRPDPRMDSAVLACLDDARLTPVDALCDAGFVFPGALRDLLSKGSKHFVDVNGVSLRQRRDQLNRRLRQARKWIKDARAGTLTNNNADNIERNDHKDSTRKGHEDDSDDDDGVVAEDQEMPPLPPGDQGLDGGPGTQQTAKSGDTPPATEATLNKPKRTASDDDTVAADLVAKVLMQINQGNEGSDERKVSAGSEVAGV